jgi:hypothetical protein
MCSSPGPTAGAAQHDVAAPPQRREAAVDDDWGPGGPTGVGVGTDNFSVRWVKTQNLGDPVAKVSIAP